MISYAVSIAEVNLLDDFKEIGFGELFEVTVPTERPCVVVEMNPSCASFLRELRECKMFTKVTVHDGLPTAAEVVAETSRKRPYIKKLRF